MNTGNTPILAELFRDISDFRSYVPYLESNVSFQDLDATARTAKKQICAILTLPVYDEIQQVAESHQKVELKSAMANLTASKQVVFDSINRRKQEVDIYRHEQEAMRRNFLDNYYNAMDSLLQLLVSDDDPESAWKKTKYFDVLSSLKIKTAADFDSIYPIDGSYLYFFRIIPFQQEAMDDYLFGYYEKAKDNKDILRKLDRCLCKYTVALSIRHFDIMELPATIRNLADESTASRNAKDEQSRLIQLADQLMEEANKYRLEIDSILSAPEGGDIVTGSAKSSPDDKFIFCS